MYIVKEQKINVLEVKRKKFNKFVKIIFGVFLFKVFYEKLILWIVKKFLENKWFELKLFKQNCWNNLKENISSSIPVSVHF